MKMADCQCAYHASQMHQVLTNQLENMNMTLPCMPRQKNGVKRNFENLEFVAVEDRRIIEQDRKRTKSNEDFKVEESMECDSDVNMEQSNSGPENLYTQKPLCNTNKEVEMTSSSQNKNCSRCQNGEPGHFNHSTADKLKFSRIQYGYML